MNFLPSDANKDTVVTGNPEEPLSNIPTEEGNPRKMAARRQVRDACWAVRDSFLACLNSIETTIPVDATQNPPDTSATNSATSPCFKLREEMFLKCPHLWVIDKHLQLLLWPIHSLLPTAFCCRPNTLS